MKILSLVIHPHVFANHYDFLTSLKYIIKYFVNLNTVVSLMTHSIWK